MTNRPTTSAVDFTSSRAPSIDEFALKVVFMLIVWACLLAFVNKLCQAVARKFWSYPVPITSASIPSKLPHPNPQGSAVSFDIPLMQATDEQIGAFITRFNDINKEITNIRTCLIRITPTPNNPESSRSHIFY